MSALPSSPSPMRVITPHHLGLLLKQERVAKKLTQQELSRTVRLVQSRVSLLERNPGNMTIDQLFDWMFALDLEIVIRPRTKASLEVGKTTDW